MFCSRFSLEKSITRVNSVMQKMAVYFLYLEMVPLNWLQHRRYFKLVQVTLTRAVLNTVSNPLRVVQEEAAAGSDESRTCPSNP